MGRKSNYSPEFKLKCVLEYVNGKSRRQIQERYGLPNQELIRIWHQKYMQYGPEGLTTPNANKKYTPELKQRVVSDYRSGTISMEQLCVKYQISSCSVVHGWLKADNNSPDKGETEMTNRKKKKRTAQSFTAEQKSGAVKWCLENNMNYQKAAEHFGCSYTQIYSWVKKASEQGYEALEDRRGKRKPEEDLTSEELSARRIKQLEVENELLRRENLLLKKLEQAERKW